MKTLNEQVILITGATDGLGKRVAQDLAARGATVLLHGRSRRKGVATLREIRHATGSEKLFFYEADLASLDAVRSLARDVEADQPRLDVLVNNAGLGAGQRGAPRQTSEDGYELRFAVNYLSTFLLTHLLVPLLRRSAPARIVNVASVGQEPIDFDDVMLEDGYDGLRAYRQTKLAMVMFTFDLADELAGSGVTVNALHPASLMDTKMVTETDCFGDALTTVQQGADAVEFVAASVELDNVTGEYFDGKRRVHAHPQAYGPEARARLRAWSEQLTGIVEPAVPPRR
jgi:NAD(P)-dependent dehydrogenase (short-subunit alcohol dehydrogenase family)